MDRLSGSNDRSEEEKEKIFFHTVFLSNDDVNRSLRANGSLGSFYVHHFFYFNEIIRLQLVEINSRRIFCR